MTGWDDDMRKLQFWPLVTLFHMAWQRCSILKHLVTVGTRVCAGLTVVLLHMFIESLSTRKAGCALGALGPRGVIRWPVAVIEVRVVVVVVVVVLGGVKQGAGVMGTGMMGEGVVGVVLVLLRGVVLVLLVVRVGVWSAAAAAASSSWQADTTTPEDRTHLRPRAGKHGGRLGQGGLPL